MGKTPSLLDLQTGIGVAGLFIPYVTPGALSASFKAIVMSLDVSRRNPGARKARSGKPFGLTTAGSICLILILPLIYVAG